MFLQLFTDAESIKDNVTWVTIIYITFIYILYSYLAYKVSNITKRKWWRLGFRLFAVTSFILGAARFIVLYSYYESTGAQITFPLTSFLSWTFIGIFGVALERFVATASAKARLSLEGVNLMNEIRQEVVKKVLNGEDVQPAVIQHYKERNQELIARGI